MIRAYKYRAYPNPEQATILFQNIGASRKIYNLILNDRNKNYENYKTGHITLKEMRNKEKQLTPAYYKKQPEYDYLITADSQALTQSANHLNNAYANFYLRLKQGKTPGYPKFKAKNKSKWSYSTCTTNNNIRLTGSNDLILPKLPGSLKLKYHRKINGVITKATIMKTRSGKWFVSLLVKNNEPEPELELNNLTSDEERAKFIEEARVTGLDLGLIDLVTMSDGVKTGAPKFGRSLSKKLAREQRKLSLKQEHRKRSREVNKKEWSNIEKQRVRVARVHEKIQNQRADYYHKLSRMIVNNHDIISVETLRVSNLVRNHSLSRSIQDAGWVLFISMIDYKAARAGKTVVKVDSFYPSSQLCSECGARGDKKGLSVREWVCDSCGVVLDRDVNAAVNILNEGLRVLGFTSNEVDRLLEPVGYRC